MRRMLSIRGSQKLIRLDMVPPPATGVIGSAGQPTAKTLTPSSSPDNSRICIKNAAKVADLRRSAYPINAAAADFPARERQFPAIRSETIFREGRNVAKACDLPNGSDPKTRDHRRVS